MANEILLFRLYDAPINVVWQAWADPAQAAQWWGPRGFTITTHSKDFRSGGSWIYTMHGPDSVDYPNITKFVEVDPGVRMVYDHGATADRPALFRVTAAFEGIGNQTALTMTMAFDSPEQAAQSKRFIKEAGGEATWDRLAEYLAKQQNGKDVFVINRSFTAPIERVYAMWTTPEHLSQWLAPAGSLEFLRADIRPGGSTFSVMKHGVSGPSMYARASYVELVKPQRLVYTQQFCDQKEQVRRHPLAATWPETMLTTITLAAQGEDETRVCLVWEPVGAITQQELDTFTGARAGMTMGWTTSLDGLEGYLGR